MNDPAKLAYHAHKESILVIFDLRDHKAAKSLHLQRAALGELGELEFLGPDHCVLIAHPGGARSLGL